ELVDAARPGVRAVEHLMRRGGDADRPWRTRMEGAARHHRFVRDLADRGLGTRRHRHVDRELAQEFAVAVEPVDAMVAAIGDIDIVIGVGRDRMRGVELAGLLAALAPRFQPVAVLSTLATREL